MKTVHTLETQTEKIERCENLIGKHQICIKLLNEVIKNSSEIAFKMDNLHTERAILAHTKALIKQQINYAKLLKNE